MSRKRNQGKARKAKGRGALKEQQPDHDSDEKMAGATAGQLLDRLVRKDEEGCHHGIGMGTILRPEECDVIGPFLFTADMLLAKITEKNPDYGLTEICGVFMRQLGSDRFREALSDPIRREQYTCCLTSLGTEYTLKEQERYESFAGSLAFAVFVLSSTNWATYLDTITGRDLTGSSVVDELETCLSSLHDDLERATVRFFSKRVGCGCLKARYTHIKSRPKVGKCRHCVQTMEWKKLLVCSGCWMNHYCSEECQASDWPNHKGYCRRRMSERSEEK